MLFSDRDWVVYSKRPFGGPEHVLQYLGRYTHRVAISNHRLVSFAEDKVTFRWRDSAHQNEQKLLTLSLDEFLRRFLLHLLPEGFMRIRNFGFLANRRRATTLPLCFPLLGSAPQTEQEASSAKDATPLWLCPKCGGPMRVIQRLTAAEIQLRSPPRHCCPMKPLSTTRNLCVCQHAQSLCASSFSKPRLSAFLSLVFVTVLRFRSLFIPWRRLPCSTAQPGHTSTPHPPLLQFA